MWIQLVDIEDLKAAPLTKFDINDVSIVCGMIDKKTFAFDSACPHKGWPLEKGELVGDRIRCPWHGYEFNIFNGKVALIRYLPKYGEWRKTGNLRVHRTKISKNALYAEFRKPVC